MKGLIILADSAVSHPDGTISMLRAGIDRVFAEVEPIPFRGTIVVLIEGEAAEKGSHNLEITCIDADGRERLPAVNGQFNVPIGGGKSNLVLGIQTKLPAFGLYEFSLLVDRLLVGQWQLKAEKLSEKTDANNT